MNSKMSDRKIIRKVVGFVNHTMPSYLPILILVNALASVTPFINIVFSSKILDQIVKENSFKQIMKTVLIMIILNVVCNLLRWGLEKVKLVKETTISLRIEQLLCDKSLSIDYELLEKKETLELIEKAQEGSRAKGGITTFYQNFGALIKMISTIVYCIIILVPLFVPVEYSGQNSIYHFMNKWYSASILILIFALTLFVNFLKDRYLAKLQQKGFELNVNSNRVFGYFFFFLERYQIGKDIRMYNMSDMIEEEVHKYRDHMLMYYWKMMKKQYHVSITGRISYYIFQGVCYAFVGIKAIAGFVSVGNLLRYINTFIQLENCLGGILGTYVEVRINCRYLIYFIDFMEIKNNKYEGTLPIEKRDDNDYEIEFKDVSFCYPNSEEMVLSHVSIKLKVGRKMAVVGPNGAGKTTFIKLLCRLYDPTEGQILLNGIDIKLYDYEEYMKLFSIVFQDFNLFSFSIAENVATSLDYEDEKIIECLNLAGFGKRLKEMPDGIKTNINQMQENGVEISGGEAQKIAIARALYKDSPLVILDEPTSALDPVSEYEIYRRFDELVKDKTSIYISHRMSSCRFCDNIVVFDHGTIVQHGSHTQLLENAEGIYAQMWTAQAKYYQ